MRSMKFLAARNRVDFERNDKDFLVALMGSLGFSTAFIKKETGYSGGQSYYRCKKASIKRADYRNGETKLAKRILNSARSGPKMIAIDVEAIINRHLRENLEPAPKARPAKKKYRVAS